MSIKRLSESKIPSKTLHVDQVWERPSDWLTIPTLTDADQRFVGLHAIFEKANFLALSASGNYTVDWGDGVVENFSSGVTAYHEYSYSNSAFDGTLTGAGFKQAIVQVYPQGGQALTTLNLHVKHNQAGLQLYNTGWLDIDIAGASLTSLLLGSQTIGESTMVVRQDSIRQITVRANSVSSFHYVFFNCTALRSIPFLDTSSGTNFSTMFANCSALTSIPFLDTSSGTNFSSMFNNCTALDTIPFLDTSSGTNFSTMFFNCSALTSIPFLDTSSGTNFSSMFANCRALDAIPFLDTSSGTAFNRMFNGCYSLDTIPLINTALGTNFNSMFSNCLSLTYIPLLNTAAGTDFGGMFNSCYSLNSVPALNVAAGATFSNMFASCAALSNISAAGFFLDSLTVSNCKLSAEALDLIYTNLPTATRTITVTGNYGVTSDNPSIATAKGWTVTG